MIAGRLAWGAATFVCIGASGGSFTLAAFLAGALTGAIPGIVAQIILVPVIIILAENSKILKQRDYNG